MHLKRTTIILRTPAVADSICRFALSAMFVSLISLVVAVEHGRTVERLVAANSWPFLSYGAGTVTSNGIRSITMHISSTGGPEVFTALQEAMLSRDLRLNIAIARFSTSAGKRT